ncbi:MAG: MerR family transcriptional regulator [Alphaproteobacteria bacterium]
MDETPANESAPSRARKSPSAFRTISEVATDLDVPQHVLRFWETKFSQLKPLKRGGGRRYYRPEDVLLLQRVRDLLYRDGYTIKGVQRLLRDGTREMKADESKPVAPSMPEAAAADEAVHDEDAEPVEAPSAFEPATVAGLTAAQREELEAIRAELVALRDQLKSATV